MLLYHSSNVGGCTDSATTYIHSSYLSPLFATRNSILYCLAKGALDGGLEVPHDEKRFVGYDGDSKNLATDVLRKYIYGGHVSEYMQHLKDDEPETFEKQFARFISAGIDPDDIEAMYKKVF